MMGLLLVRGSLRQAKFIETEVLRCQFVHADLRGADFSDAEFGESDDRNIFTGAKYNSSTKFPEGFDPEAEGMIRVADLTADEERSLIRKGSIDEADEKADDETDFDRSKLPIVEGLFLQEEALNSLDEDVESLAARINGATWPPTGYEGAHEDAILALEIEEILRVATEGSSIDSKYFAFVLAPGAEMPGEEEALNARVDNTLGEAAKLLGVSIDSFGTEETVAEELDDSAEGGDDRSGQYVLLHLDAEDLEKGNPNWWKEFYEKGEYEARKTASALMYQELSDLSAIQIPSGRAWNHAIYSGTSKSGAEVGVMAVRFDEDDDELDEADYED